VNTIASMLVRGTDELRRAGVDSPGLSARVLLAHALNLPTEKLVLVFQDQASHEIRRHYQELIVRRSSGEPVAYILGRKEFYSLDFQVSPHVLIPRPETELLVELVGDIYSPEQPKVFADLGTGSGILGICISIDFPLFQCLACDISKQALSVARSNACMHRVSERILFFRGDMGAGIKSQSLDFIVCNPPYISARELAGLGPEVRDFEPGQALLSEERGLGHIKRLEQEAARLLRGSGRVFLEMGSTQAAHVRQIFSHWSRCHIYKDLAGLDRAAVICRQS